MAMNYTHTEPRAYTSGACRIPIDSNMNTTLEGIIGHVIFSKVHYGLEGDIMKIEMEVLAVTAVKLVSQMLISTDLTVAMAKEMDRVKPWESQYV